MRENRVKRVMREGGLAIVSHVGFADPAVVEIIALAGFDGAFIDMEHTGFDLQLIGEMIRVADLTGITSIVRVPDNDTKLILRILDMGAQGIQGAPCAGAGGRQRGCQCCALPSDWGARRRWQHTGRWLRLRAVAGAHANLQ